FTLRVFAFPRANAPPLQLRTAVQDLLEENLGGHGVDAAGLPPRADAGLVQPPGGLGAGERLTNLLERQAGHRRQALAETADPLGVLATPAFQIHRISEDQPLDTLPAGDLGDLAQGRAVVAALERGQRYGEPALRVRDRQPDAFLAEVDAQGAHAERRILAWPGENTDEHGRTWTDAVVAPDAISFASHG